MPLNHENALLYIQILHLNPEINGLKSLFNASTRYFTTEILNVHISEEVTKSAYLTVFIFYLILLKYNIIFENWVKVNPDGNALLRI